MTTQIDRIEIAKAKLRSLKTIIDEIIFNNCMGDSKTKELSELDFDTPMEAIEGYEAKWNEYVDSGQCAQDFQEGELLKREEFRNG